VQALPKHQRLEQFSRPVELASIDGHAGPSSSPSQARASTLLTLGMSLVEFGQQRKCFGIASARHEKTGAVQCVDDLPVGCFDYLLEWLELFFMMR
jgi:hypothetical protein